MYQETNYEPSDDELNSFATAKSIFIHLFKLDELFSAAKDNMLK